MTIYEKVADAGGRLKVRSALNPALWLCAIVTVPALSLVAILRDSAPKWLIFLVFVPVFTSVAGFLFLLLFDRDKLQSEEYQLRKRSLELIQEKGDRFQVLGTSIEAITNPHAAGALPSGDEEVR